MEEGLRIENGELKIASKREQRPLVDFAEREQLKDSAGGLKLKIAVWG